MQYTIFWYVSTHLSPIADCSLEWDGSRIHTARSRRSVVVEWGTLQALSKARVTWTRRSFGSSPSTLPSSEHVLHVH